MVTVQDITSEDFQIRVYKSERRLELWGNNIQIGAYPIGLGTNPVGPKKKFGDAKTPEGSYYVCTKNDKSKYYLSLGISYPNTEDANEAFAENRITEEQLKQITEANERIVRPPWDTPLGGEIMIHGHGSQKDWTIGCIAVEDEIMDLLWKYSKLGTRIMIYG